MTELIYNPIEYFRLKVTDAIRSALAEFGLELDINLETPPEGLGDFAFPCFNLAPALKKKPEDIAQELSNKLSTNAVFKFDVKGPYINFIIAEQKLVNKTLPIIFELDERFGTLEENDIKVILEHTSANPTDKLHVGRARNPIIGDTLARILNYAGYDVQTQYYVDDMGKQSARKILESRHSDWDKAKYRTGYQWATSVTTVDSEDFDQNMANELEEIMDGMERGKQDILKEGEEICNKMMDEMIIPSLDRINIKIDKYVNESQFMLDNSVNEVVEVLKNSEYCGLEDGAKFIDLNPFDAKSGKDKFFFTRADGKTLYATRDIAYHQWKFKNCDVAINILGEDHKLESVYVKVGLGLTGIEKAPENIFYAFVNLPEGRMSTRMGKVVYLDDLMDEAIKLAVEEVKKRRDDLDSESIWGIANIVGIGAVRFNIIRVQAEKKIIFRWEEALNFEGDSAPFVQYAHARACSILKKAEIDSIVYSPGKFDVEQITNSYELDLVRVLAKLPEVIYECADKRAAHLLANYAHESAAAFNQFYRVCPVLQAKNPNQIQSRLALVDATRIALKNTLGVLGISAPEKM